MFVNWLKKNIATETNKLIKVLEPKDSSVTKQGRNLRYPPFSYRG